MKAKERTLEELSRQQTEKEQLSTGERGAYVMHIYAITPPSIARAVTGNGGSDDDHDEDDVDGGADDNDKDNDDHDYDDEDNSDVLHKYQITPTINC